MNTLRAVAYLAWLTVAAGVAMHIDAQAHLSGPGGGPLSDATYAAFVAAGPVLAALAFVVAVGCHLGEFFAWRRARLRHGQRPPANEPDRHD